MNEENISDTPSLEAAILQKEREVKMIRAKMAKIQKARVKKDRIRKKEFKELRKRANSAKKAYWNYLLTHSRSGKDIAMDGISGGINQN